ncbi:MAG: hypothetical protein EBY65_04010 [Acidimicrobiia bacterium]|nr:hypothetical protein [Acidimicrobiia bacterium]
MFETLRSTVRFRRFRFGRATRQLDRAANVMDLRAIAKRRLPGGVFDYIDGAAEDERSLARSMTAFADIEVRRAGSAGFDTIVPTVDLATFGRRERDVRRGFELPPKIGLDTIVDGLRHPSWTWDFLTGGPIRFANVAASDGSGKRDGTDAINLAAYANEQLDPSLSWDDIEWFRSIWNGPIVVKGVQSVADARIAAELGIEAIAISNHGGRQLEGSPPPIELIAPVRDAIGDACEIICDGGIRRGADIVKALALGADATMGGRAHFFGLGAAGERGVELAFGFLHDEFRRAMALNGLRSVSEITPDVVSPPRNRTD